MREISTLLNLEVIAISEGRRVGTVSQVLYDLAQGKLLGLILGTGAAEKGLLAEELQTVGPDVIMIQNSDQARRLAEVPELMKSRRDPEAPAPDVLTSSGQRLGKLGRVFFDEASLEVESFEVSGGPWRDLTEGLVAFPVGSGLIHGPDTVILPEEAIPSAVEAPGLRDKMEKASVQLEKAAGSGVESIRKAISSSLEASRTIAAQKLEELKQATEAPPPPDLGKDDAPASTDLPPQPAQPPAAPEQAAPPVDTAEDREESTGE